MNISCPLRFRALFVWLRLVSCAAVALFFTVPVWALQALPVVSLSIPNLGEQGAPANGALRVNNNSLFLAEKAKTYISGGNALQTGSVRISRSTTTATTDRLTIGYSLEYFNARNANVNLDRTTKFDKSRLTILPNYSNDVRQLPSPYPAPVITPAPIPAPTPVAINSLQGDLSPNYFGKTFVSQRLNTATYIQPNTIILDSGITSILINFTARFSDQSYCCNPGLQGLRMAILHIFPLENDGLANFQIQNGADSIFILLEDPPNAFPVITNRIPDQFVPAPIGNTLTFGAIELESPQWRTDYAPRSVFYDDNYDPVTYTAFSSANTPSSQIITLNITSVNPASQGKPMLIYSIQPGVRAGTTIPITLQARDNRIEQLFRPQEATFNLRTLAFTPTSVAASPDEPTVTISPNPAATNVVIQGQAQKAGVAVVTLLNSVGGIVLQERITVSEGAPYYRDVDVRHLAPGMYIVQVEENGQKATRKLIKQ